MVQLEKASKIYRARTGPVRALDTIDLRIGPDEFVAVRGPSGSGKSTLLFLIGGMLRPTEGVVRVMGRDLYALPSRERVRLRALHVGFVFQTFPLVPYLTALDNTLLGPAQAWGTDSRQTIEERARALLTRLGLSERLDHRPGELSAGERQRVALARALLKRPRLILADEPTGNLDPESAQVVMEGLADYHRQGAAVLVVTHEEAVAAHAQRTVRLRQGRLE
jgi:putative ABC transport system ATP-binding protein